MRKKKEKAELIVPVFEADPEILTTTVVQEPAHTTLVVLAKKDFVIVHNEYKRVIKVGDDLSDVPQIYWQNLKTEKVIV